MTELLMIAFGSIFVSNFVFARFLGICPFLGVSKKVETAVGMGLAVTFVMALASGITYGVQRLLVQFRIEVLQTLTFILVIAVLVQFVEMVIRKTSPILYQALGIYLPLITTNCAVMGVALINVNENYTFIKSVNNGIAAAMGFTLAIVLFAGIRERLDKAEVPKSLAGFPIALVTAGLISLAFLGFNGFNLNQLFNYNPAATVATETAEKMLLAEAFRLNPVVMSVIVLSVLGALFGIGLAIAAKKLAVASDPRVDEVEPLLPGANCGACGYPGCRGLAEAIVGGQAPITACPVNKDPSPIAQVMGVESEQSVGKIAKVRCLGGKAESTDRFIYMGIQDCAAAHGLAGGAKGCGFGCLGLGSCVHACPFGAITMNGNGLPEIDAAICTGCGICVGACPRDLFILGREGDPITVLCRSFAKGPEVRKVCKVGCIGCGICVKNCPVEAIVLKDNLAEIDHDRCTGCGICVEKCPMKTIKGTITQAKEA